MHFSAKKQSKKSLFGAFLAINRAKSVSTVPLVPSVSWYGSAQNLTFAGQNVLSLQFVEEESPGNIEYPAS